MAKKVTPKTKGKRNLNGGKHARTDIDWELVEQFYITGEVVTQGKAGDLFRRDVTFQDVAKKVQATVSLVHYHATKRNWRDKRDAWKALAQKEVNEAVAKARAYSFVEASSILDEWLMKFQAQLRKDNVRVDSISDFNIALKLKRFIEDQPIPDSKGPGDMSIGNLQGRHKKRRQRDVDSSASGVDDEKEAAIG